MRIFLLQGVIAQNINKPVDVHWNLAFEQKQPSTDSNKNTYFQSLE